VIAMASNPPSDPRHDLPEPAGDPAAPTRLRENTRRLGAVTLATIMAAILVMTLIVIL
jgi:hypothetical protein